MEHKRFTDNLNGIYGLWLEWIVSSGAVLAVVLTPLVVRPIWTPLVAAVLEMVLYTLIRAGRTDDSPRCLLPFFITTRILFWSALAMIGVIISYRLMHHTSIEALGINREIPFIPILIVAPIGAAVSLWMRTRGSAFPFCVDCKLRFAPPAERGFLGTLFSQEGTTQIRVMQIGYSLLAISSWAYYLIKYANDSLTAADRYFFFGIPAALWVIAAIYMSLRYMGIYRYYDQNVEGSLQRRGASTRIRFLIVSDNKLLLSAPDIEGDADSLIDLARTRADTPAEISLPYRRDMSLHEAVSYLEGILPIFHQRARFLYSNTEWNADCNIFHFLVSVDNDTMERLDRAVRNAQWVTIHQYVTMLDHNLIDPLLASEVHRVYTMSMAFKTYDRSGRRLYPIKHYRPTFRLCEVIDCKVDYSDRHWLYVAHCNQDNHLYRLRSLWRRHINGLSY